MPTRARKRLARHIFNFCSIVAGNRTLSLLSPPRCSAYCLGGTATFFWRFRRTVGHESFQVLLCRDCTLTFTILPLNKSEQAAGSGWRTRSCRVFNAFVRKHGPLRMRPFPLPTLLVALASRGHCTGTCQILRWCAFPS